MKLINTPDTFDPDDLRIRHILNIVLWCVFATSLIAIVSEFYGYTALDQFLYDPEFLYDPDDILPLIGSTFMVLTTLTLIFLNRSRKVSKTIIGAVFVAIVLGVVAVSDYPSELARGRSLVFWILPIMLSLIVLPPAAVFIVDAGVFVFLIVYAESVEQINTFGIFLFVVVSVLGWLGMSIANRAIRDARNEAEMNRAILNGVADGVIVLDDQGRVTLANPTALRLLGEIHQLNNLLNDAYLEIGGRSLSLTWSRVPGVGHVAIVRDITRQVEVERAKDAILGVVSHEMRTPLAAILGFAETLKLSPSSAMMAGRIHSNAERLMRMVNDLLDHAQIQAGALRLSKEPFDVRTLASAICDQFALMVAEKNISLTVDVDAELHQVIGDFWRLQQIVTNLVGNAIKFTEVGEVKVSFHCGKNSTWQITVSDTGIGIPPERLPDIFEPFRRASDYNIRKHQGAGLGLSIAKRIAALAGGDITVVSKVGEGSTFTVTLPLEAP
ncbi:MAG TPA: HAMP domain-containing sensor histidine kinase [Anaerolineales bacterium]|nr:HAMP domain-containing sensor histidine kinase [Anaerolineales bacterium]